MADDFLITAGSGTTIAAKEVSSKKYQRVIPEFLVSGTPTDTDDTAPFPVKILPTTANGCLIYKNLDVNATGVNIKSSAGQIYGGIAYNQHASSKRYLKLYNKASAPTVGSDVVIFTIPLTASTWTPIIIPEQGAAFGTGIGLGATTGIADADTGAPSANDVVIVLFYK